LVNVILWSHKAPQNRGDRLLPNDANDLDFCATMSVPKAGKRFYGLSPNGSYAAARRGEIITVPVGRLLRVPVKLMERKLGIEAGLAPKSDDHADK
jgi:hypothetical protein